MQSCSLVTARRSEHNGRSGSIAAHRSAAAVAGTRGVFADPAGHDPSREAADRRGAEQIALKWEGVKHVLIALLRRLDSIYLRAGAHHVLAVFAKRGSGTFLKPVVHLLQGMDSGVTVPLAAQLALQSLRDTGPA